MTFALKQNMNGSPKKRSLSRLAAVQALYQHHLTGMLASDIIAEFHAHRFQQPLEEIPLLDLDRELFNDLVLGAGNRIADIDLMITANLAETWKLERLDAILLAILRCAIYEMWCRTDIPVRVTIDEYVSLTADFFDQKEPHFINGVLQKISGILRGGEQNSGLSLAKT
jgi:transcription antitermination protein NusB